MAITIAIESPLQDDVRVLVASLNDYLLKLTPPEFVFHLTVDRTRLRPLAFRNPDAAPRAASADFGDDTAAPA